MDKEESRGKRASDWCEGKDRNDEDRRKRGFRQGIPERDCDGDLPLNILLPDWQERGVFPL